MKLNKILQLKIQQKMIEKVTKKYEIGVIIARFQVDELTPGHKELIDTVVESHSKTIIFLGVARTLGTKNNPLEFGARKMMIQHEYPNVTIVPIQDVNNNEMWSKELDRRIREVYPYGSVVLYGSRDSFIPHYMGRFDTQELEASGTYNGTAIRRKIGEEIILTNEARRGVIYASHNRFPQGIPSVEVFLFDAYGKAVFIKKSNENKLRLIGTLFDPEQDETYESTAHRICNSEFDVTIGNLKYITNQKINDWRYRGENDKIITTLFTASSRLDTEDIERLQRVTDFYEEVVFVPKDELELKVDELIIPEHVDLVKKVLELDL